jgi:hypothetical protein
MFTLTRGLTIMPPFLALHAIASKRGDGLRPELLALFEQLTETSRCGVAVAKIGRGPDCMIQSGPHPALAEDATLLPEDAAE